MLIVQSTGQFTETITGEITLYSSVLKKDGSYYEPYTFECNAGESLTFETTSNDFDAYLISIDSDGSELPRIMIEPGEPMPA